MLSTYTDLLLVILGFGLIIVIHELGHFIAARWAGIRVLAFAVGFGPAICSYRKGLGWRRGSSEPEVFQLQEDAAGFAGEARESARSRLGMMSHTEYRLNFLPLGGYVKMLGQDDLRPGAVSAAPDSFQSAPPWKRMIVISAGVVANIVTAALLFMLVFLVGLPSEPPVVGWAAPGAPAAQAVPLNAHEAGVAAPGLRPGDRLLLINGRRPNSFNDLVLATTMSRRGTPVRLEVERAGVAAPLRFEIVPEQSRLSGLLEMGVSPPLTARIVSIAPGEARDAAVKFLAESGLPGVEPGMTLVSIDGKGGITGAESLHGAVRESGGRPLHLEFRADDGRTANATLTPEPEFQVDAFEAPDGSRVAVSHLLALTPVMTVADATKTGSAKGLRSGDVFARIGSVEYPSIAQGIGEVRAQAGGTVAVEVLRPGEDGARRRVSLGAVAVSRRGTIGFAPGDSALTDTLLAVAPPELIGPGSRRIRPDPDGLVTTPGSSLTAVGGTPVANLAEVRAALLTQTGAARQAGAGHSVHLTLSLPGGGEATRVWALTPAEVESLHSLSWRRPDAMAFFEPQEFLLKADDPLGAVSMGLSETRRVMLMTYMTFVRLFEGTVKVEHLKGPVGIAHLGTLVAGRGFIYLLFFLALISVNLAVINFLPLPIVDGGQFLFIVYERVRRRPVPVGVQNAATLAGLVLIGVLFVVVTFNDIRNLIAP